MTVDLLRIRVDAHNYNESISKLVGTGYFEESNADKIVSSSINNLTASAYRAFISAVPYSVGTLRESIAVEPYGSSRTAKVYLVDTPHPRSKSQSGALEKAKAQLTKLGQEITAANLRANAPSPRLKRNRQASSLRSILSSVELAFLLDSGGSTYRARPGTRSKNLAIYKKEKVIFEKVLPQVGLIEFRRNRKSQTKAQQEAIAKELVFINSRETNLTSKTSSRQRFRTQQAIAAKEKQITGSIYQKQLENIDKKLQNLGAAELEAEYLKNLETAKKRKRLAELGLQVLPSTRNKYANNYEYYKRQAELENNIESENKEIKRLERRLAAKGALDDEDIAKLRKTRSQVEANLIKSQSKREKGDPSELAKRAIYESVLTNTRSKKLSGDRERQARARAILAARTPAQQRFSGDFAGGAFKEREREVNKYRNKLAAETEKLGLSNAAKAEAKLKNAALVEAKKQELFQFFRSRNSLAESPYESIPKGSPTANWIGKAQRDFSKELQKSAGSLADHIAASTKRAIQQSVRDLNSKQREVLRSKLGSGEAQIIRR